MDWEERLNKIRNSGDSVEAIGVKTGEDRSTAWKKYLDGLRGFHVPSSGVKTGVKPTGKSGYSLPGAHLVEGRGKGYGSFVQDPGEQLLMRLSEETARKQAGLLEKPDAALDPELQKMEMLQKEQEYTAADYREDLVRMVNGQVSIDRSAEQYRQDDGTMQFPSAEEQMEFHTRLSEQNQRGQEVASSAQALMESKKRYVDGKGFAYYTNLIDKAIEDGNWEQASAMLHELTGANLSAEERDAAVSYIDKVTSRHYLTTYGGVNDPAYQAKQEILLLADTGRWEELYLLMNSEEGEHYKEIFREAYGINADSAESRKGNYAGLVDLLEATNDSFGYDTLMDSGESLKTQLANSTFMYRVNNELQRASQSSTYSVQMGSYTRAQTAYYILDALAADLGVEDNGIIYNVDSPQTQYLLQYLKETCHVDLTGMDESNYRSMIRTAMDEQSQKARIMGDVLKQEGFDIDAVREYYELSVQSGYEEVRQKSFEEWKKNADAWDYIGLTALSVPFKAYIQPLESLATLSALGGRGSDVNDPNTYVPMLGSQNGMDMIRSATVEAIEKNTDWELFGRNVASFAYTTGMSSVDSMVSGFSLGKASIFFMGMTAAGTEANNILSRGGNRRQALYGGIAAGAIEAVTEYFSVDKLLKNVGTVDSAKALFHSVGQQMFTEGTEEMSAEVLGIIVDAANMGNLSENSQAVQMYMAQGMSYDQARVQVLYDNIGQVLESGVSGSFSGGISAGVSGAVSYAANRGNGAALNFSEDSTAVNDDPAEHTPEEMRVIEEYKNSTDSGLLTFIQRVRTLNNPKYRAKVSYDLGAVSQRQAQDVQNLTGVDVSSYTNSISGGAVDHIDARHGVNGKADRSMKDDADFARIGHVLQTYDSVELLTDEKGRQKFSFEWQNKDQTKAQLVKFAKKIDGTYYVVEAVPDSSKQKMHVVSAYMQKNSGSSAQLLNMEDGESSPQFTSQTPAGMATSAEDTVSQTSELVNEESSSAERKTVEAVFEMLLDFGVHKGAAQSLAEQYDPAEGVKPETYARGAAEAWHYGRAKFSEAEMLNKKGFSVDLSEKQRSFAYRIGQVFQRKQTATKEAEIRDMKKNVRKDGKQGTKGDVQFSEDIDLENMTERQKVSVEALEKLAKALGAKFRLFQSEIRDGKPVGENGWYDPKTGEIHIDIQAGENGEGTILFTAAHELTHFIYQWSPAKFKILADFLVEQYGKKGQSVADLVRAQQEKAKRNGRKLGWSEAYQEMVADSMETMLSDGKVIEKLMELRARDKSLVQKIRAWFKAFAEKLRAVYRNMSPDTQEGRLVAEMVGVTERLQELFTEALAEAGENYRTIGAQKNTAAEGGEVLYSLREGLKDDLEKVKNRTFEASKGEVEIGNTSEFLVNELDADPLAMFMPPTKAYRAMVTEEQAIKDGQPTGDGINYHGLGVEGLYALLEKSEHPIAAFADTPTKENNRLNRIVLVTDYEVGEGLGIAIVEVDSTALINKHRVSANKTITAFDKRNAISLVKEAYAGGRLLYIDKKNGQLFNSGVKGANCPTAISEGVRKKNIQDFWANVKWKKSGKQEMSFDGGQKVESGFAEAFKNAGKLRSDRGNITTRSVLEDVDTSQVKSEARTAEHGDEEYLFVVSKGDMKTAQRMVDEAAKRAGYTQRAYHGTDADRFNVFDPVKIGESTGVGILGDGFYFADSKKAANKYGETVYDVYLKAENTYHASEADLYKIKAVELEKQGYDSVDLQTGIGKVIMVLDPQQIKSADPVTYDNDGNVIPLSERFNPEEADIRYSDRGNVTSRDVLDQLDPAQISNEIRRKHVQEYQNVSRKLDQEQRNAAAAREELRQLRSGKGKRDMPRIRALEEDLRKANNRIDIQAGKLLRMEQGSILQRVLQQEQQKTINRIRREDKKAFEAYRAESRQSHAKEVQELREKHLAEKKRNSDTRKKAEMRTKIKKQIGKLRSLFVNGTKEKNIKADLRGTAASVLASAEMIFDSAYNYSNEAMVRNGVGTDLTDDESRKLNHYVDLLARHDALEAQMELYAASRSEEDLKRLETVEKQIARNKTALSELNRELRTVFERERHRLNEVTLSSVVGSIAEEYAKLKNSEYGYVQGAYDEGVYGRLMVLKDEVDGTIARDMSLTQLTALSDAITMVTTTISNAGKLFVKGKAEDLRSCAETVISEIRERRPKNKSSNVSRLDKFINFAWGNLKPVYAMRAIGSKQLEQLYWECVRAEGVYAKDIAEAGEFISKMRKQCGFTKWDRAARTDFDMGDGRVFSLNVEQMMSIYAYSRREQALKHMLEGGFEFDGNETFRKGKFGPKRSHSKSETYRVDLALLRKITNTLTDQQRQYAEAMQDYLSQMGEKGNEASRMMYGIDLFTEKHYFPLKSSKNFLRSEDVDKQKAETTASLKNSGMTKETVANANNPIVLSSFDDVWLSHVNQMANYHAFVVPIDNLNKVFNYTDRSGENNLSFRMILNGAYGTAATKYLEQYIKDLNGGISSSDGYQWLAMSMFGKFKGAAVGASLSTAIQQPTAILRAMAYVRPDYFLPVIHGKHSKTVGISELYGEMKKYAPIAVIKEIGGFDVGSNSQAKDYIGAVEYRGTDKLRGFLKDGEYRKSAMNNAFGALATWGDELGWTAIWCAVKREVAAKQKQFAPGSEAYLKACGDRFTEVIALTQVYDSVNSRSGLMRSKGDLNKFATSFAGEPTTSLNMLVDAVMQFRRGGQKMQAAKSVVAVFTSIIAAAAAASVIYASRDDDEDKPWGEKWAEEFGNKLAGEFGVIEIKGKRVPTLIGSMIPYVRDLVSVLNRSDVGRPDMSLASDLVSAFNKLTREDVPTYRKVEEFAGAIAAFFEVPLRNIMRDARGIFNAYSAATGDLESGNLWEAFKRGFTGKTESAAEQLYTAMVDDDSARVAALKENYADDYAFTNAVRGALRENDSRIEDAAIAHANGDVAEYIRIVEEILAEGHFDEQDILAAIRSEENGLDQEEAGSSEHKHVKRFDAADYLNAILSGDRKTAAAVKDDLINEYLNSGKDAQEAQKAFISSVRSDIGDRFKTGELNYDTAMDYLVRYGELSEEDAYWKLDAWSYVMSHGSDEGYSKQYSTIAQLAGNAVADQISASIAALPPEEGYTSVRPVQKWEAIVSADGLTGQQQGEVLKTYMTESQVEALEQCLAAGVSAADFVMLYRAKETVGDQNGNWSQDELRSYLDKSKFTRAQKAAIWEAFCKNWKSNPYK